MKLSPDPLIGSFLLFGSDLAGKFRACRSYCTATCSTDAFNQQPSTTTSAYSTSHTRSTPAIFSLDTAYRSCDNYQQLLPSSWCVRRPACVSSEEHIRDHAAAARLHPPEPVPPTGLAASRTRSFATSLRPESASGGCCDCGRGGPTATTAATAAAAAAATTAAATTAAAALWAHEPEWRWWCEWWHGTGTRTCARSPRWEHIRRRRLDK